jgi:hypothetical protein
VCKKDGKSKERRRKGEEAFARTGDRKTNTKRAPKVKLRPREQALEEFHAWHIKYDDLAVLLRVERQIMEIEDALSEVWVPSKGGVSPLSSAPSVPEP